MSEGLGALRFAPPEDSFARQSITEDAATLSSESIVFNAAARPFVRLDVALGGTIGGWTVRRPGMHHNNLTDGPQFIFPQLGVSGSPVPGVARYGVDSGHGLTVFFPRDVEDWNRKIVVTAHGGSSYGSVGTLEPLAGPYRPLANRNKYVGTFIDKGYAVVHTLRSSAIAVELGDLPVTFADGERQTGFHLGTHAGLMVRWGKFGRALIEERLGMRASHVYFYGFSSGGMQARLLNYVPGINDDGSGAPFFAGLIVDDCGGGVPVASEPFRPDPARFVPQIELTHALYDAPAGPRVLENKRENVRLLEHHGVGALVRHYELAGVSHFDAGYGPEDMGRGRDSVATNIDLSPFMSAAIDLLDAWVVRGEPPPSSCRVELPEIAAPLGVYFPYPAELGNARVGLQTTGFAAFDGVNLEPLDGIGRPVDMNGSGARERRETLTAAWVRLGLVPAGTAVTRATFVRAVRDAAMTLAGQRLLDRNYVPWYVERAERALLV